MEKTVATLSVDLKKLPGLVLMLNETCASCIMPDGKRLTVIRSFPGGLYFHLSVEGEPDVYEINIAPMIEAAAGEIDMLRDAAKAEAANAA